MKSANDESWNVRVFRALLWLYPAPFRLACADDMTEYFAERMARARDMRSVARLWFATLADVVSTAVAERYDPSVRPTFAPREEPMSSLLYDLRHAARRLRNSPAFTIAAAMLLAVGIGLNAAVFNLVDTMLYRPAPFTDPDRIVHIYQDSDDGEPNSTAFPAYRDIARDTAVFASVAATSPAGAIWETADGAREAAVTFATASYFPVLGLRPFAGRWFAPEHDVVGAELVAVVSHRTWLAQMGGDPAVIGSTVRLNNQPVTVIGIGPARFNGEAGALVTDFWLSISTTPVGGAFRVANLDRREDHWYQVKARLREGVPIERARAAMQAAALRMGELFPDIDRGRDITVFALDEVRFHPGEDDALVSVNIVLLAVAGLVLLLACANLANLLLARGIARTSEIAVREALGAGRSRVVRLLMLEALMLSTLGGVAGLAVGAWAMQILPSLPIPTPGGTLDTGFDQRVLVFGLLLTVATGAVFGLVPALRSARTDVSAALRDEARGHSAGRRTSLFRASLVVVQVAVSIVLVVGAGLLARSLANAQAVDPGFDADRIAVIGTSLTQAGIRGEELNAVSEQLLARIAAIPGVERVALTTRIPVAGGGTTTREVENYRPVAGTGAIEMPFAYVSRDYFATMGIALRAGRAFGPDDRPGGPGVVVVNEAAAQQYWNGNAVGGRIRPQGGGDGSWATVIGVVADARVNSLREPPTPMMYFSAETATLGAFNIVARVTADPASVAGTLRTALREVRATLPVTRQFTMNANLGSSLEQSRVAALLLGGFSMLALILASLGVYAVVSFGVERRTQEMGIRAALGASSAGILRMVIGESLVSVGVGLAAGLVLATVTARALEGMLFGVGTTDPVTFLVAAGLLLGAAGIGAYGPARRASRTDPMESLRKT